MLNIDSMCKPLFKVFETLINFSHLSFFAHKGEGNSFKFLYADQDKESICNISNIDSDFLIAQQEKGKVPDNFFFHNKEWPVNHAWNPCGT